jgi:hypothetical protein
MTLPARQRRLRGRHALVDGIPFDLPVNSERSPALMTAFTADADAVQALLPGEELHAVRLPGGRGLLMVTVIDYRTTDIGRYVEFSIAFGVTHGRRPRPLPVALLLQRRAGLGQYVWDLPVSTLVSVKGGKGIWGMPKHQANLDFRVDADTMSSQYDLDGTLCMRIEVRRPQHLRVPLRDVAADNYCQFRGMLMRSSIFFSDRAELAVAPMAHAQLLLGDHPRMEPLRGLDISSKPLFVACMPQSHGVLDDHVEGWFLTYEETPDPDAAPEGLESVAGLANDETWLAPPVAAGR